MDFSHLNALELQASNCRIRLNNARTTAEFNILDIFVKQCETEVLGERDFLGLSNSDTKLSDYDLWAALEK